MNVPRPLKKAKSKLFCVLFKADPDFVEVWAGFLSLFFGLWLLEPGVTFQNPAYALLPKIMTEDDWGFLFVFLGSAELLIYFFGPIVLRRMCLFIMFFMWTLMSVLIHSALKPYTHTAAPVLFFSIALAIGWAFVRVGIMHNLREVTDSGFTSS